MTGPDDQEAAGAFDDKLRDARRRHGLDGAANVPAATQAPLSTSAMSIAVRVGAELVSALAVAAGIGWLLDRWLHTTPIFIGVFVLLGGAAGVLNVWRLMGRMAAPGR